MDLDRESNARTREQQRRGRVRPGWSMEERMKTGDILKLIRKNKPLPEGCTIGGYADLGGYNFALPEGCTIGGYAYLRGYNFALPEGCIKK